MTAVNPYLMFDGDAEKAFTFYHSVFGGDLQIVRYSDMGDGGVDLPEQARNRVAHAALPLGGPDHLLMASDCPPGGTVNTDNPAYAVSVEVDSRAEAERIFQELSVGGEVMMPIDKTEWAELFGTLTDRFAVPWMVGYTPR